MKKTIFIIALITLFFACNKEADPIKTSQTCNISKIEFFGKTTLVGAGFVQVQWSTDFGVKNFDITLFQTANQEEVEKVTTGDNRYIFKNLLPETEYTIKIQARCQSDILSPLITEGKFISEPDCILSKPTNIKIADLGASKIKITWDAVVGAAKYSITLRDTLKGYQETTFATNTNDNFIELKDLYQGITYECIIVPICSNDLVGNNGSKAIFTTSTNFSDEIPSLTNIPCFKSGCDVIAPTWPGSVIIGPSLGNQPLISLPNNTCEVKYFRFEEENNSNNYSDVAIYGVKQADGSIRVFYKQGDCQNFKNYPTMKNGRLQYNFSPDVYYYIICNGETNLRIFASKGCKYSYYFK